MIDGVWDGIGVLKGREVEERGGGERREREVEGRGERERWMDEWMEYISMDEIPTLPTIPNPSTLPYPTYLTFPSFNHTVLRIYLTLPYLTYPILPCASCCCVAVTIASSYHHHHHQHQQTPGSRTPSVLVPYFIH